MQVVEVRRVSRGVYFVVVILVLIACVFRISWNPVYCGEECVLLILFHVFVQRFEIIR